MHFSLSRGGILFLGGTETAAPVPELFSEFDRTHRIYRARIVKGSAPAHELKAVAAGAAAPEGAPPERHVGFARLPAGAGLAPPHQLPMDELHDRLTEAESSCEELQSHNEELSTVNAELKARLDDTGRANDDLNNLIASVDLATLFVGPELTIMRFTPRAAGIFNLIPRDVGRKLLDITHRLDYPQLKDDVAAAVDSHRPLEREVTATEGRHYIVRVLPYRHPDDRARAQAMWRDAVRSCGGRDAEVRLEDPEGGWRRANVLATPRFDEQGNIRKWSGCIIDTDERAAAPSGSI